MTTNLERGDIDSVCKCFFNYIRQVAAAFGVDLKKQSRDPNPLRVFYRPLDITYHGQSVYQI